MVAVPGAFCLASGTSAGPSLCAVARRAAASFTSAILRWSPFGKCFKKSSSWRTSLGSTLDHSIFSTIVSSPTLAPETQPSFPLALPRIQPSLVRAEAISRSH